MEVRLPVAFVASGAVVEMLACHKAAVGKELKRGINRTCGYRLVFAVHASDDIVGGEMPRYALGAFEYHEAFLCASPTSALQILVEYLPVSEGLCLSAVIVVYAFLVFVAKVRIIFLLHG